MDVSITKCDIIVKKFSHFCLNYCVCYLLFFIVTIDTNFSFIRLLLLLKNRIKKIWIKIEKRNIHFPCFIMNERKWYYRFVFGLRKTSFLDIRISGEHDDQTKVPSKEISKMAEALRRKWKERKALANTTSIWNRNIHVQQNHHH